MRPLTRWALHHRVILARMPDQRPEANFDVCAVLLCLSLHYNRPVARLLLLLTLLVHVGK